MKKKLALPITSVALMTGTFLLGYHASMPSKDGSEAASSDGEMSGVTGRHGESGLPLSLTGPAGSGSAEEEADKGSHSAADKHVAGKDPSGAFKEMALSDRSPASRFLEKLGMDPEEIDLTDPDVVKSIVEIVLHDLDPLVRRDAFDFLLSSANAENLELIRSAMHHGGAGAEEWRLFDYASGAEDHTAVLDVLAKMRNEKHQRGFLGNSIPGWASADPGSAIDFVESLENGALKNQLTGRMLEGLMANDPRLATDYLLGLENSGAPNTRAHAGLMAATVATSTGIDAAFDWIASLPRGGLQSSAVSRVSLDYAVQSPRQALDFVNTLESGPVKSVALYSTFEGWTRVDPQGASKHILTMESGFQRDQAIHGMVQTLINSDPDAAAAWVTEISNPSTQETALNKVNAAANRTKAG
ncbi:MAG: hypothetical protein AAGJ79_12860 [Verrucomicrobiota bacterium]